MDKVYLKIEKYLQKNFPKKELIRFEKLTEKQIRVFKKVSEIYGIDSMKIAVIEIGDKLFYQLLKS